MTRPLALAASLLFSAATAMAAAAGPMPRSMRLTAAFTSSAMSEAVARRVLWCSTTMQFVVEAQGVRAVCEAGSKETLAYASAEQLRLMGFEIRPAPIGPELHDVQDSGARVDLGASHDPDFPQRDGDGLAASIYQRAVPIVRAADARAELGRVMREVGFPCGSDALD